MSDAKCQVCVVLDVHIPVSSVHPVLNIIPEYTPNAVVRLTQWYDAGDLGNENLKI